MILTFCVSVLLTCLPLSTAQSDEQTGQGVTEGLADGDVQFTFTYPQTWRETRLEAMQGRGSAIALMEHNTLGIEIPVAVTALFLVEADRAINVLQNPDDLPFPLV